MIAEATASLMGTASDGQTIEDLPRRQVVSWFNVQRVDLRKMCPWICAQCTCINLHVKGALSTGTVFCQDELFVFVFCLNSKSCRKEDEPNDHDDDDDDCDHGEFDADITHVQQNNVEGRLSRFTVHHYRQHVISGYQQFSPPTTQGDVNA